MSNNQLRCYVLRDSFGEVRQESFKGAGGHGFSRAALSKVRRGFNL